ncbi:MAG: IPT/TIG domain-containing protein [Nitrospiraceae bacterium]
MTKLFRQIAVVLIVGLLSVPAVPHADQAQYFYDELGRLVAVVDSAGNVAVYVYDEVGNLLRIDRPGTGGQQIGIFFLTPGKALVNTNVTIKGFGFSATPAANEVKFNGVTATVVSAATDTLVATVPTGATTGPVTVTNTNGTATSPQTFTVLVPPIITDIDPALVPQGATTQTTIAGFNLLAATSVTFMQSGLSATIRPGVTANNLPINVIVAATVPTGMYAFSVTTPGGTAQSGTIQVTVTTAVPSFGVGKLSVFRPFPAQTPPSGPTFTVAPPLSVSMP